MCHGGRVIFLVCVVLAIGTVAAVPQPPPFSPTFPYKYGRAIQEGEHPLSISWSIIEAQKAVRIGVRVFSEGWLAVGFNTQSVMDGSSGIRVHTNTSNSTCFRNAKQGEFPPDAAHCEYDLIENSHVDGWRMLQFTRPLSPKNKEDHPITKDQTDLHFMFAFNSQNSTVTMKHDNAGYVCLNMIDYEPPPPWNFNSYIELEKGVMEVFWRIDGLTTLVLGVRAHTTGWVAVGLNVAPRMGGVSGARFSENFTCVRDIEAGVAPPSAANCSYALLEKELVDGVQSIQFSRPLVPQHPGDYVVTQTNTPLYIAWAINMETLDISKKHHKQGSAPVVFIPVPEAPPPPPHTPGGFVGSGGFFAIVFVGLVMMAGLICFMWRATDSRGEITLSAGRRAAGYTSID